MSCTKHETPSKHRSASAGQPARFKHRIGLVVEHNATAISGLKSEITRTACLNTSTWPSRRNTRQRVCLSQIPGVTMTACNGNHIAGLAEGSKQGGTMYRCTVLGSAGLPATAHTGPADHSQKGVAKGGSELNLGLSRTACICPCLPGQAGGASGDGLPFWNDWCPVGMDSSLPGRQCQTCSAANHCHHMLHFVDKSMPRLLEHKGL